MDDAQPKMRFSLSPPPQKAITASVTSTRSSTNLIDISSSTITTAHSTTKTTTSTSTISSSTSSTTNNNKMLGHEGSTSNSAASVSASADEDAASDYNQWLHAMKLVARLPGGTPPEFRRKLWLSLADKYLKSKNVDWTQQREKCFCEEWREDDEELGIQIVKDLHRTGSNLCTGPAGSINQAKLKRILLGYARYNPEVGYCQGFNMLGALILQVMDKEEEESMKVMIYLVEGVLPTGYFYGSMGGLQADMGVFRELMQTKLPRLAKHLQRLQGGPVENAYEPPLTNVFTMQWFLTMFCTCLPMSCVLRVWDLVLIEGSDVLLRTALVLWSLLEERVLNARTADEFYGKMGSFSSELLNGHLIDSNGLIEKVVKLGPIADLRQLRDKHLYNIAPLRHKQGIQLYYDDDDTHSDEERMAVATVWGLNWGRRGSVGPGAPAGRQPSEQKDRLALDISLLKKQYDRLRERQKQAHVILTTACSTATRQTPSSQTSVPVNQLLQGRHAIMTNKGKRVSAPLGAIPPARKPSLPAVLHGNGKPMMGEKQLRRGETLLWRDTDPSRRRRDSLTWKEIKADRAAMLREGVESSSLKTQKLRTRLGKSDSSSYSEDSDGDQDEKAEISAGGGSSTDTSLCDDDDPKSSEKSPKRKAKVSRKLKEKCQHLGSRESSAERQRPKSWAPGTNEIPFMLMGMDSGDEKESKKEEHDLEEDSATESGRFSYPKELDWTQEADNIASCKLEPLDIDKILPNTAIYLSTISLSPPKTEDVGDQDVIEEQPIVKQFDVSDSGVTNQYFERVNSVERPNRLELSYSLNEEEDSKILKDDHKSSDFVLKIEPEHPLVSKVPQVRDDNIPGENKDDYKELLSMTIEEHKPPAATITSQLNASRKRRDPRRKTLTRSSTIEIEERFQALERTLSQDQPVHKFIPSTAALEERYNSLEKQLSAEKQRKEEDLDRIPSIADLETRFNALTKQMSSSESSNSRAPLDLDKNEQQPAEKSKETERKSNENQSKEGEKQTQSEPKETATEKESPVKKEKTKEIHEEQQPRLKKLPSTAELEDRFNALERKMSVQKSSPAKTKKEPPDEEKPAQETEAPTKENKSKQESSPQKSPENKETSEKSTKNSKDSDEVKDKVDDAKRKVPPSTEELEKRFNALEKQLSTTNLEAEQPTTSMAKEIKSEFPKKTENIQENKQEIQSQKSIKSFDEKVKVINTKLTADEQKIQDEELVEKKRKSFNEKCERASGLLKEMLPENEPITSKTARPEIIRDVVQPKELGKRRASEPPSTEDLEKRYESLKRRMSSKNHFGNLTESANESMSRHDQEVISETLETGEPERKQSPPTTENLESRYEKLHGENTKTKPKKVDVAIEAHISPPPAPPPPPKPDILADPAMHKQRALIEELQAKIQEQGQSTPGEENLKPSEINPQRKQRQEQQRLLQRPTPMGDETSEAPAKTAYYRSGNYEPWQQQHQQKQRMVRRFSDLPSRADLENRLQFLEKQLYKKFYKQRCASDSEVASRTINDDKPSTSAARVAEVQLEQRVLALEKQLSENSLKLLEAMRANVPNVDGGSPRRLSTDTIDATGKELVRYTQNFGELDELGGDGSNKPINISINIKMMLNKEQQQQQQRQQQQQEKADSKTSTEDLRLRLEQLEQQLLEERAKNNGFVHVESVNNGGAGEEAKQLDKTELSEPEEMEANKKQEKDSHNQTVKSDETEMTEDPNIATTIETIEPETVKETKTLENEEIAHATQEKAAKCEETEETAKDNVTESSEEIPKLKETQPPTETENHCEESTADSDKIIVNATNIEPPVDPNNKTVVLLMDNEPRASRVRRLTRANTEELEGLFQALEKQLQDRNLIKSEDGRLIRASTEQKQTAEQVEQAQAISDLTKEIEDFTSGKPDAKAEAETKVDKPADGGEEPPDDYDWGPNPVKHHLKRKTVYLPSTKELEARFRSLERQIKLLEDVEKIDVEQRLNEIERKIKLQYSLSHEKDLNKYLELCEGKGLDEEEEPVAVVDAAPASTKDTQRSRSPARKEASKSPYTSPSRKAVAKSPHASPARKPVTKSPYTSPSRASDKKRSPYTSPVRRQAHPDDLPISDDLEYKYRVLDLVRSKSKDNLSKRKIDPNKKPPIHPLEMLLDPSPDDSEIPTTGELEHRIRLLDEKLKSPCRHKSRSSSPTIDDMKRKKLLDEKRPKSPVHTLERLVSSPCRPEPPTEEELEQRMRALEEEKRFDFKTQKDYKAFNQKLKDVISPSLSFEEFKATKSREQSPRRQGATTPKSAMRRDDTDDYRGREETPHYRPTSPKTIRFRDEDDDYYKESQRPKSRQSSERMKTLADRSYSSSIAAGTATSSEGLDALGSRLMRETSPITRTGTHTGVPLRTGENINDRLSSIKDTIKSIDTLCQEKPYQKEKCQRYIDSLFSDSLHFGSKKNSLEELTHSRSESRGRTAQRSSDYTPAIRVTSEHRSLGSADSKRTSPLRASSPLHHRSHRDISRELSPRRRRDAEDMEERESSRVRRDNMLPNYFLDNRSDLSSGSSLTKFHKVDRQLEETCAKYEADDRRSASRTPLSSPYESRTTATRYNSNNNNHTGTGTTTTTADTFQRPVSPYRQPYDPYRRNVNAPSPVPVYQPAKLEIRHTTVTSTFYDRFLTEKQIEKQTLSRPPSRSPVVSPSASIAKSYTDLPGTVNSASASASASQFSSSFSSAAYKPTVTTAIMSSSFAGTATSHFTSSLPTSKYSYLMSTSTVTSTNANTTTTTTTSSSFTTVGSSGGYVPYNFSSSFSNRHSDPIANSSGISGGSTGVYNPMMSFTLREPTSASGSLLGQYAYKSSFVSNYSSSSNQMPKSPSTSDQEKL
ncbi:microtubule-associated protein futsch isoform X3 [Drosophila tropicalis]|uniref:microtubule-associated protein futsch isoform X3 n=1 Tax=Drosophila tropicalis TaxID=46794 RepID=UPI0035AB703B